MANQDVQVLPWPALSPDLNPIENLWSILKDQLKNEHAPLADELWARCEEMWKRIPPETCQKLIRGMATRCQAVKENNGQHIDR